MPARMYFVGVTTAGSSVHSIFDKWAALAAVPDAELRGIDIPVDSPPQMYREAISRIAADPDSRGALITTHKAQVWEHARDLFTSFDEDATTLGEVSCVVRRGERLTGLALDTATSRLALKAVVGDAPFRGAAVILGAGGAGVALAANLLRAHEPESLAITDISAARLHSKVSGARLLQVDGAAGNTRLIESAPPGSLIVNATGVGKDRPGSPILPGTRFPSAAIAWDFNYRGSLLFLDHARASGARIADGWEYFLHGWSQHMSHALGFELTPELFARMRALAGPGIIRSPRLSRP